jgi:polyisoprenoid-binding protein YceI
MRIIIIMIALTQPFLASAQKYLSEKNRISFHSSAPLEDIRSDNYKSKSVFDASTGDIVFTVPINTFQFEKSLMQEHFNEKYLESHKFPKAKFKGKVIGFDSKSGTQEVTAEGMLEIHGESRRVSIRGEIEVKGDMITIRSVFPVKLEDYRIRIPKVVVSNIAEVVEVSIEFMYKLL